MAVIDKPKPSSKKKKITKKKKTTQKEKTTQNKCTSKKKVISKKTTSKKTSSKKISLSKNENNQIKSPILNKNLNDASIEKIQLLVKELESNRECSALLSKGEDLENESLLFSDKSLIPDFQIQFPLLNYEETKTFYKDVFGFLLIEDIAGELLAFKIGNMILNFNKELNVIRNSRKEIHNHCIEYNVYQSIELINKRLLFSSFKDSIINFDGIRLEIQDPNEIFFSIKSYRA